MLRDDELLRKLDDAGAGSPKGRLNHVCFGDTGNIRVGDIWESPEAFEKFGETLRRLMQDHKTAAHEAHKRTRNKTNTDHVQQTQTTKHTNHTSEHETKINGHASLYRCVAHGYF